ncbi:fibronectin type III domain-containing protein [Actinoplanes sp. NPDC049265]|uniref:fibronectin type III domain-containing protein n=1 Tax=Actinoplanes sp. NPDC049265 TaxID=3363902 RepID=UPI00371BC6A1
MTSRLLRALRPARGGRLPLALLALVVAIGVTAAVSDASASSGGLHFAPFGHWTAQPAQNRIFHVNGSTGTVDAEFEARGLKPGDQVVQGDAAGYVISDRHGLRFGKSNLMVEDGFTMPPAAAGEQPVGLEARGGPYYVYPELGRIVRLSGADPVSIAAGPGGPLGTTVVTPDGTLWVQHRDSNGLCFLTPDADRVTCGPAAPAGHTGGLTVVGKRAVFVDTESDTLTPVDANGLGRPVRIGRDLPADAKIATTDAAGRLAVLDPGGRRLHLIDASGLDQGRVSTAATVEVPPGTFETPAVGRDSVVLLDRGGNHLYTYDRDGRRQRDLPVSAGGTGSRLTRGEDQRIYVESGEGKRVLVVGDRGKVDPVELVARPGKGDRDPVPPPGETTSPAGPTQQSDQNTPRPGADKGQSQGTVPPRTQQPRPPKPPAGPTRTGTPKKTTATSNPPSPPGIPSGLKATVSGGSIKVTWNAANANGSAVTGYRVTWSGGSSGNRTVSGGSRSATLSGLTRGKTYRITVAAQNAGGRGAAASTRVVLPPATTRSVTVSRGDPAQHGDDCNPPECAYIKVVMRGFKPKTSYQIDVYSRDWGNFNPGAALSTDDKGNLTVSHHFPYNGTGGPVWVVVDGLESNHVSWPS